MRIFKMLFLLAAFLHVSNTVHAQRMDWKDFTRPPSSSTRDYGIGSDPGMAWSVALGTPQSWDTCEDVLALSDGGYFIVGINEYIDSNWDQVSTDLVLYRLTENGEFISEKRYSIPNHKSLSDLRVIENPLGGFVIAGSLAADWYSKGKILIVNCNANGDTLSTRIFSEEPYSMGSIRIIRCPLNSGFYLFYRVGRNTLPYLVSSNLKKYGFDMYEQWDISSPLNTNVYQENSVAKEWGVFVSTYSNNISYSKRIAIDGNLIDSFPEPFQGLTSYFLPLNGNRNAFFNITSGYSQRLLVSNDYGDTLVYNPLCFSGANHNWFTHLSSGYLYYGEMRDGTLVGAYTWDLDFTDTQCMGLVKMRPNGELLGDTVVIRSSGDLNMKGVAEGSDGRLVVYGKGSNGPLGKDDIFIAKLATWNPVGIPNIMANSTKPLQAFPTIVNRTVRVDIPPKAKGTLSGVTAGGATVFKQHVNGEGLLTLNATQWPSGAIIIYLATPEGNYSSKLIKN